MKWHDTHPVRLAPVALMGMMLGGPVMAADNSIEAGKASMLERLAKSDARAAELQQRVEQLEKQVAALKQLVTGAARTPVAAPASAVAQAAPARPAPQPASAQPSAPRPAAGSFEIDEDAAQRALERTLTQAGALLLPARTVSVTPGIAYVRTESTTGFLASLTNSQTSASDLVLANRRNRKYETTASVDFKLGMPLDSQLEMDLPFNHASGSQVDSFGNTVSAHGDGTGDITAGLAKTLARESGWRPDLIARIRYNFGNGKRQDGIIGLNAGYRQLGGELVALKRQDPLAFTASLSHTKVFEENGIQPGDISTFGLGAALAASPYTSMQFGFSQIYRQKQEVNGIKVGGSDQAYGILSLGASSVLSRDIMLITQLGIGLGNDAPKYNLTVSLPILFR